MFSSRVPSDLAPNRLAQAIRRVHAGGRTIIDLTVTNPTVVGFDYQQSLLQPLASARALTYDPRPFGLDDARRSIVGEYARRGIDVAFEQIILTASTSDAYSLLFRLLCDGTGDDVLVPVPSYPLFDHLTQLDGVRAAPYRLEYHGRWALDIGSVDRAWSGNVRALLAVSPNNPTGSLLSAAELDDLTNRCAMRDAALILDEVFADYPLDPRAPSREPPAFARRKLERATAGKRGPVSLTFRLGGLSKSAGLPQVKLGWIAVQGPEALVRAALERLELICDTYLSVSTPVQVAATSLIESGEDIRRQILERLRRNHRELHDRAARHPAVEVLHADAGWSVVIRVPSTRSEEELVLALIEQDDVLVHPGFFFDFPHESFLVVSLLQEPAAFDEGIRRVLERVDG